MIFRHTLHLFTAPCPYKVNTVPYKRQLCGCNLSWTRSKMPPLRFTLLAILFTCNVCLCFPSHRSLAGLSARELDEVVPTLKIRSLPQPPGPLDNPRAKLVTDPANPWIAPGENDIRGPCPGINTLANHGVRPPRPLCR